MSDSVKMPAWLPMSRVLENLGWKRSRLGPGLKGTVFSTLGVDRKSKTYGTATAQPPTLLSVFWEHSHNALAVVSCCRSYYACMWLLTR